jgi:ubiquinone/menaquinone biosynthesis C-methylase UbiE
MIIKNQTKIVPTNEPSIPALYWSLSGLDTTLPEYVFREDFAKKLSEYNIEKILTEAVYLTKHEMMSLVSDAEKHVLQDVLFSGVGVELGAGTGLLSSTVANFEKVEKIYALEIVKNMVDLIIPKVSEYVAQENKNKIQPTCGSFNFLELQNNSVDFIFEIGSLHHSSNIHETMKESFRVLKKGGFMLCFDRSHPDNTPDDAIQDMLTIEYGKDFLEANGYPLNKKLTRAENGEHELRCSDWKKAFEDAGFRLEKLKFFIKPSLKGFIKGLFFSLPYFVRRSIYTTVNMGNYQKQIPYYLNKLFKTKTTDTFASSANVTVFLAIKK